MEELSLAMGSSWVEGGIGDAKVLSYLIPCLIGV
jgi:hypothetical protein